MAVTANCYRAMADGNNQSSGKNVSFCTPWQEFILKDAKYKLCVKAIGNKARCFTKIFNLSELNQYIKIPALSNEGKADK
jgi:hypothetical protein